MRIFFPTIVMLFLLFACARHDTDVAAPPAKDVVAPSEALPAVQAIPLPEEWRMNAGLLRAQMEAWAARAGYQIVWQVSRDYHMQNASVFRGTFVDALKQLFSGMQDLGNSFKIMVYQGNSVVVITEK